MLVAEAAGLYFQCFTALTAHSARIGLPPAMRTESTRAMRIDDDVQADDSTNISAL